MRAPRTSFTKPEPADFRVENQLLKGGLRRLSMTGGCAVLQKNICGGTFGEIAISTRLGPVCGLVEFLGRGKSTHAAEVAFRFIAFNDDDHERLSQALKQLG